MLLDQEAQPIDEVPTQPNSPSDVPQLVVLRLAQVPAKALTDVADMLKEWAVLDKYHTNEEAFELAIEACHKLRDALQSDTRDEAAGTRVNLFDSAPSAATLEAAVQRAAGAVLAAAAESAYKAHVHAKKTNTAEVQWWLTRAQLVVNLARRWAPDHPHALVVAAQLCMHDKHYHAAERLLLEAAKSAPTDAALPDADALSSYTVWRARAAKELSNAQHLMRAALKPLLKNAFRSHEGWNPAHQSLGDGFDLQEILSSPIQMVFHRVGDEKNKQLEELMVVTPGTPITPKLLLDYPVELLPPEKNRDIFVRWRGVADEVRRVLALSPEWLDEASDAKSGDALRRCKRDLLLDLRVLGWNLQCSLPFHNLSERLPAKMATLAALTTELGAPLAALTECPGSHVEKGTHTRLPELFAAAMPRSWRYAEAATGSEAAGFAYDEDVQQLMLAPVAYTEPAPARTFRRPPVLAIFAASEEGLAAARAEPLGLFAVLSVHLKSVDNSGVEPTRKELRSLADVLPWVDGQLEMAVKKHPKAAAHGKCVLLCGDFNVAVDGDPLTAEGLRTHPHDAWNPLLWTGLKHMLPAGEYSNFGPPCAQNDQCYDAALLRCEGAAATAMVRDSFAYVYPAMEAELADVLGAKVLLKGRPGPHACDLVDRMLDEMLGALRLKVKTHWGDHKPVVTHLRVVL
ncbi:hypothetical protein T492DRAFT_933422 [Pavlovales sp. CCMP2436]|nr:hypothetical protein T492DRAFT_933422 [Pavlovales sp. CCMP2436]